ncbi:transcriptional regulator, y4mF family [compost metagenome]|jgi:DNA-binding XRE family transcriptional regulator|uniref:XRE family transcriptional regulator n=1 Tax=Cupriavidus necator TaxID=106590 RepID=A0A367PCD5_CUPNE|nr:XRE family transcriptional regulator [Cupriavidus necator]QQX88134.1 helix-turn-helix transcriptional regulator [Cupriavidus necator]RCJ05541.1 XRE family transcriptional regulator [Cupriavidus necator]
MAAKSLERHRSPLQSEGAPRQDHDSTSSPSEDEEAVCQRLRHARIEQGLTLEALAEQSGFTKGYLSKIENGKKAPPIASLARIARAMGLELSYFFLDPEQPGSASNDDVDSPVSVVHHWERKPVVRGGSAYGYDYVSLAHKKHAKYMDPFMFTFPSEINLDYFFEHPGEEFVFLLSGKVEFEFKVRGKLLRYELEAGDSLYFESSTPHRGRALEGDAQAIVVVTEPTSVGSV